MDPSKGLQGQVLVEAYRLAALGSSFYPLCSTVTPVAPVGAPVSVADPGYRGTSFSISTWVFIPADPEAQDDVEDDDEDEPAVKCQVGHALSVIDVC